MLFNHVILCHRVLLLPSIFPSIRVFSSESVFPIKWARYRSFGFSISPPNGYSGLISFKSDRFDQESSPALQTKASVPLSSVLFMVQISHPYMTTGKTITLTICTLVSKLRSLLFTMLSRIFIAFLPRSKRLLISWLQSSPALVF